MAGRRPRARDRHPLRCVPFSCSPLPGVLLVHESEQQLLLPEADCLLGLRQLLRDRIRLRRHRETGGLRPYPEQGLLPDLPQPQREPRRGVHRHVLLPELPVQRQHRRPGAARQRRPAGPRAPAQPAVGPAAARALTPQLRKEGPAPPRPRHDMEASSSDPSSCSSPRSGLPPAPPPP